MVLQAPKPRSSKKNPSSARANSFNPKGSDVRKEELGVQDPRDDRRASESKAAEISRQHVRPAITRTETDPDASSPRSQTSPRYDTNPRVRGLGTAPSASPLHKPATSHPGISRINSTPNFNVQFRPQGISHHFFWISLYLYLSDSILEGQDVNLDALQSPVGLNRPSKPQYKPQAYQPQAYQPQAYQAPDANSKLNSSNGEVDQQNVFLLSSYSYLIVIFSLK